MTRAPGPWRARGGWITVGLVAVACGTGDPSPPPARLAPAGRDAAPTERGSYIMSGSTKLASLHPASGVLPFNVALRAAELATGRGARVGQSFAALLALVPELKCSPEWGEGYQQLTCDMPDGWSAIFPAGGRNFKDLDTIDSNEQARKLVGRNRLSLLQWYGRVSQ